MIPYSDNEQKTLVERLCQDILVTSGKHSGSGGRSNDLPADREGVLSEKLPLLQILFDLEFERKFEALLISIYRRLPVL